MKNLEETLNNIKEKKTENFSDEETSPINSPIKIPTLTPRKEEKIEKIEKIEKSDSLYPESSTPLVTSKINPHTPVNIKVESPRSPKSKTVALEDIQENISIYQELKRIRYTIISYLVNETTNKVEFIVCFDPSGQIVFITIDEKNKIILEDCNVVTIRNNDNDIELNSFQTNIQERITLEIRGVVFYTGDKYIVSLREEEEFFHQSYEIIFVEEATKEYNNGLCQTFIINDFTELINSPNEIIQATRRNYQIIQQYQLLNNQQVLDNIIDSVNQLSDNLKTFNKTYNNYSKNIIDDWRLLSSFSKDYYKKFTKDKLSEEDNKNYESITINMFARFQAFNQQIMIINDMVKIIKPSKQIAGELSSNSQILQEKDDKYSGKIIELQDLKLWV